MSSPIFQKVVSKEFVATLGIDMSVWGEDEQNDLHERMTILLKDNPDLTDEEEVKEECENQVDLILYAWFKEDLGYLVEKSGGWSNLKQAYLQFKKTTLKNFMKELSEKQKYQDFCQEFYDDLRQAWNICGAGMWDEYQRMKKESWSFAQYRSWLKTEIKKRR